MAGDPNRRFRTYILLILAVALLAWALVRGYNVVQDHERNDAEAPAAPR